MQEHFAVFGRYNAWANRRLYDAVAALPGEAASAPRKAAYFGSIIGTLNHILVADRLWLGRIEGAPVDLKLDQTIARELPELRRLREEEDNRILDLVAGLSPEALERMVHYHTSRGEACTSALRQILTHVFNHQTHHRGQAHALVKEAGAEPPPLDLMYFIRERESAETAG